MFRFGRPVVTVAWQCRHTLRYGRTMKAVSLTGLCLYQHERTQLEPSAKQANRVESLVVPTVEATIRACRLVSTVILMISDYEFAKISNRFFPDRNEARARWEKEESDRRKALERAQIEYTSPTSDEIVAKSGMTRKEFVQKQKQAVLDAAQRLAEAEEALLALGDRRRAVHRKAANRLLSLCRNNGGAYIKVGQHVANLDYLIPDEYIQALSTLFDDAPRSSYEDVCRVIEEDLGMSPDDLFESFETEPIASASLAQVHVAYDKCTGKKLAIKCQHRGLRETSGGDLLALTCVVRALERTFKDFNFGWIADEIAPQLPKELDFMNEGKNAERISEFIQSSKLDCVIPKIIWGHSSERVLCMEFEEGFKATDVRLIEKAGLKKEEVASLISSLFNAMVFTPQCPVHVDPHPANVLIRERRGKPQIVLVDHGLYREIDDDFRIDYAKLWQSLMLADLNGIKMACEKLGVGETYTLFSAMLTSRPYDEIMERAKTGSLSSRIKDSKSDKAMIAGYAQHFMQDIFGILGNLPRQMLLLLKMNDCLRHIDFTLGSPTNTLVISGKYAAHAIYERSRYESSSWYERISAWMNYVKVLLRVKAHDAFVRLRAINH